MPDLSVVLPVYNASDFLENRLSHLSSFLERNFRSYEIVAVDDGSSDGSAEVLLGLPVPHLRTRILPANAGKFAAVRAGMEIAEGNCCLFTDADVPYELEIIPCMVRVITERGFHIAIGDRNLPGARYKSHIGALRSLASQIFTLTIRLFVTSGLFDTQCGIKAFRQDVAREIFAITRENRFAGDVEILYIALKYNLEIKRIPARLAYQGTSTIQPYRDAFAMIRSLLAIRWRYHQGLYRSAALAQLAQDKYWET